MSKKFNLINVMYLLFSIGLFGVFMFLSLLPIMIIGESLQKFLCGNILSTWNHCYYVDPIGDISEKTFLIFCLPLYILFAIFIIYILTRSNKKIKKQFKGIDLDWKDNILYVFVFSASLPIITILIKSIDTHYLSWGIQNWYIPIIFLMFYFPIWLIFCLIIMKIIKHFRKT